MANPPPNAPQAPAAMLRSQPPANAPRAPAAMLGGRAPPGAPSAPALMRGQNASTRPTPGFDAFMEAERKKYWERRSEVELREFLTANDPGYAAHPPAQHTPRGLSEFERIVGPVVAYEHLEDEDSKFEFAQKNAGDQRGADWVSPVVIHDYELGDRWFPEHGGRIV